MRIAMVDRKLIAILRLWFLGLGIFLSSTGYTQEMREFYNGIRALGMGGASIAVVGDETALLVNPANLGKLRKPYGTLFDPEVEGNEKLNTDTWFNNGNVRSPLTLTNMKTFTDADRGKYFHSSAQIFPSYVAKNLGIGVFARQSMSAEMNAAGTEMNVNYYDDLAVVMGVNFSLFDGRIKIGANGKMISRIEIDKDNVDPTGPLGIKDHATEGAGLSTDIGLTMAAPWMWLPTISAVVRNLGGTEFSQMKGFRIPTTATNPTALTQDYDVAIAIFPQHGNSTRSSLTFEHRKVTEASTKSASEKLRYYHLGYEFNYGDILFLRAGMNQNYWTAGAELASEFTQIQLATYAEEIGVAPAKRQDRRYVFKFAFRF